MSRRGLGLLVGLALVLPCASGRAQTAAQLLAGGVVAYEELDFAAAAQLLDRAVALESELDSAALARALTYLAAAQVFRDRLDEATTAFRKLLLLDARRRPDSLHFPPRVQQVFEDVRQATKTLYVALPGQIEMLPGRDTITARVYASSFHDMEASVEREDGTAFRVLYSGPIRDSLALPWDGRGADSTPIRGGSYRLTLVSRGPDGSIRRSLQVPLDVGVSRVDTLPLPRLADSLLLAERTSPAPALLALASGAVAAGLVALLPEMAGARRDAGDRRYVVVGVLGLAGLAGVVHRGLGRPLPENVAANARVREAWQQARARLQQENARLRASGMLTIRAGVAVRVEGAPR